MAARAVGMVASTSRCHLRVRWGGLGAQRTAQQRRQRPVVRGGVVLGWVGRDDALGDGRLVGIEERAQVHLLLLSSDGLR